MEKATLGINGYLGEIGRTMVRLNTTQNCQPLYQTLIDQGMDHATASQLIERGQDLPFVRELIEKQQTSLQLTAVNNRSRPTESRLLTFETAMQRTYGGYRINSESLTTPMGEVAASYVDKIENLPFAVDIILEATGAHTKVEQLEQYRQHGKAQKVILACPFKDKRLDPNKYVTIIPGVNDEKYNPDQHDIISVGSCTSNAFALLMSSLGLPAEKVKAINIDTIHAKTPSQNGMQGTNKKEGALIYGPDSNLILTSSGISEVFNSVFPEMRHVVTDATSIRVNIVRGSLLSVSITVADDLNPSRDWVIGNILQSVGPEGRLRKFAVAPTGEKAPKALLEVLNEEYNRFGVVILPDTVKVLDNMIVVKAFYNNVDQFASQYQKLAEMVASRMPTKTDKQINN